MVAITRHLEGPNSHALQTHEASGGAKLTWHTDLENSRAGSLRTRWLPGSWVKWVTSSWLIVPPASWCRAETSWYILGAMSSDIIASEKSASADCRSPPDTTCSQMDEPFSEQPGPHDCEMQWWISVVYQSSNCSWSDDFFRYFPARGNRLSYFVGLLSLRLVRAVVARNYVRSSFSQWSFSMTRNWTQNLSIFSQGI